MDELIYELSAPLKGTGGDMMSRYIVGALVPTIAVSVFIVLFILIKKKKILFRIWIISSAVFSVISLAVLAFKLNAIEYFINSGKESSFIEDEYVDPVEVKLTFPKKKRNLIYIYLESMEMTYSDIDNGGGFEYNMIPELTELAKESECFSGDDKLNGAYSTVGTTWTMGAMFAQSSGLPLKTYVEGNAMSEQKTFFPEITCIGDILAKEGYYQELLIGSDAVFGGRELFFSIHGNYEMHDYGYALENKIIPDGYKVYWGYEDTKLFENAKKELLELSKKDEPFNLTMLTVDTHHPDGYVCDLCEDTFGDNKYANVIACSDKQVCEFVEWIKKQDFYKDTTVVVCGDHPTMNGGFCDGIDGDYVRKTYTAFINSAVDKRRKESIQYSSLDMFPTTLAAMGVKIKGNKLGLGTNLFSGEQTLIERLGSEELDSKLSMHSAFMDELSGIADEETKRERRLLPDANINVIEYDEAADTIAVEVDDIINVEDYDGVNATLYGPDNTVIDSKEMSVNVDRTYSCSFNIGVLQDRVGTVVIETIGKDACKVGELSGDLSLQAHESFEDYVDLLNDRENIAVLFAACGDFTAKARETDLNEFKKLGIDEKLVNQENIGFYAVRDIPALVYGAEDEEISYDGAFVGDDVKYHIESSASQGKGNCSITVDGDEYALNEEGINCVVYDYESHSVIDSACFDLNNIGNINLIGSVDMRFEDDGSAFLSVIDYSELVIWRVRAQIWDEQHYTDPVTIDFEDESFSYMYFNGKADLKDIDVKNAYIEVTCYDNNGMKHNYLDWKGDLNLLKNSFEDYLSYGMSLDDTVVLMSVKDDMFISKDDDTVQVMKENGLSDFSAIGDHEAYYAVIKKDEVLEGHGIDALYHNDEYGGMTYAIESKGWDSGYNSSIKIDGEEVSRNESGMNIVLYDTVKHAVIDSVTYRFSHMGSDSKGVFR
ncbi:sulfatase-like hydrolase/transferase [Butyrivibrio sp. XB500-5]|uniref:sulfatase-like hydrolase/transferase n=1 Tax=Butyrivibrio sp. XB500-5 TaxID=2364880 RepID=UPI001314A63D|nr:sulfatase-like hydrolase/transferase [Butyrivibrio sp. XB500-5]